MSIGSWVKFEFLDERDRPTYALNAHTGERVWGGWWYPNLITNQGLDGLAIINSISDNMGGRGNNPGIRSYLGLFTGSLAVKRPSGDVTLAQSGNIVTSSAAFFQAGDVGSEIVWDNAFQSPTEYLELIPDLAHAGELALIPCFDAAAQGVDVEVVGGAVIPHHWSARGVYLEA